jgi:two-component system phosphate regulon sensor histidine kinase PhoR
MRVNHRTAVIQKIELLAETAKRAGEKRGEAHAAIIASRAGASSSANVAEHRGSHTQIRWTRADLLACSVVTGSLFRRLLFWALALLAATLLAADYTLTRSPGELAPAEIRERILLIFAAWFLATFVIIFFISRAVRARIRRLKLLAESFPGGKNTGHPLVDTRDEMGSLERSLAGVAIETQKLVDNLRYESARREAILSSMTEGVLAVDRDLRITFCNRSFLRAVDFRGVRPEGRFLLEVVRDPDLREILDDVLAAGEPRKSRFRAASSARIFEAQAAPLEMPTGRGAIAILRDITDLERLEQVRKDFVANVSHEFRTPLSGIIGYADTLLDGALEDAANNRRFVEIIRANAVRLSNIAADLLILSELESGADAETDLISIRGVIESALTTVAAEAKARGVNLIREEVENLFVNGARLRLEQAILNLLANAIKFNRPGGEVRIRAARGGEGRVMIRIADTGIGILSQDLPRIFERFYRVDKARSREVGGTGLGLSIVKHVIERMNGAIQVESQFGRGTVFTVSLPAADQDSQISG